MTKRKNSYKGRDIFLSEFWGIVHSAVENGRDPPFSDKAISFVESAIMAEPVLTDTAKALLYYMQENIDKKKNFFPIKELAVFLHTTGYGVSNSLTLLQSYNLVYRSEVGHNQLIGYSLTERGKKYNPLGEDKDLKDIILSIIE